MNEITGNNSLSSQISSYNPTPDYRDVQAEIGGVSCPNGCKKWRWANQGEISYDHNGYPHMAVKTGNPACPVIYHRLLLIETPSRWKRIKGTIIDILKICAICFLSMVLMCIGILFIVLSAWQP